MSELLQKAKDLLDGIEFLGNSRAMSDYMASDIEYDVWIKDKSTGVLWRQYVEPCLLKPYDALVATMREDALEKAGLGRIVTAKEANIIAAALEQKEE